MLLKSSTKPLHYLCKSFCTIAYNFEQNGVPTTSKANKIYILRILLYTITFVLGNFFTGDMISTGSLDEMAFLLANVLLVSLAIYTMIWSVVTQATQVKILNKLKDQDIKRTVWAEVAYLSGYFTCAGVVVAYNSNFDLLLVMKYLIFFVLSDVIVYTVLFQFINTAILIKQKLRALNEEVYGKNIKLLANAHRELYFISVKVRKLYGFICLWIVATFFLWIMCDMYRFVNAIVVVKHQIDEILLPSLIATTGHYLVILVMVGVCNSAKMESQRFKILFSRAVLESRNERFSEKKKLCLLLLHQDVNFKALDWFELDYSLFYTITESVISYLVVLQQLNL